MEWTSHGTVIAARRLGERSLVAEVLTADQGRHAGLYRPSARKGSGPGLMVGDKVLARWRARLGDHLGVFEFEVDAARAARLMDDAAALAALQAACALAHDCLPEREAHPGVAEALEVLLDHLGLPDLWPALLVRWEAGLLSALGYGLDLRVCAATGQAGELTHVSPRSGRAVSRQAAEPYLDKLLALPAFLVDDAADPRRGDIEAGLALTGYFLERRILWPADRRLPEARGHMVQRLRNLNRL